MRWRLAFVLGYFALCLFKASTHEIWADEAEYWAEARDSHSLTELYANSVYVGQPLTTFFPFYLVSRFTRDPFAMQVVNAVEISAAVAVVVFSAPWPLATSALFAFGYFPLFEYGTISRHYALPLFFGLLFCALYRRSGRLSAGAAAAAGGLAVASFHGTILALALLLALAFSALRERRRPSRGEALGYALVIACMAFAIATAVPPSDSITLKPWVRAIDPVAVWRRTVLPLWVAFAPLPPLGAPWWNHGPLDAWPVTASVLGLVLLGVALSTVRASRLALAWLIFAVLGLQSFAGLQWGGFARHAGLVFVSYVLSYWLSGARSRVFPLLLLLQLPGGLFLSYLDLVEPFSPSVATAAYIRSRGLAHLPMLGYKEFIVTPVFTLLDRPYYSPQRRAWVTHPEFSTRMRKVDIEDVRAAARVLQARTRSDVLLVLNAGTSPGPRLVREACFDENFVRQRFCVFRLLRKRKPAHSP